MQQNDLSQNIEKCNLAFKKCQIPETGSLVYYYNQLIEPFLIKPLTKNYANQILKNYAKSFEIKLNQYGFVQAAERTSKNDQSNYHAIWVRDNIWAYFYLKEFKPNDAKTLIKSLMGYYLSDQQTKRFYDIIENPSLSLDPMQVPHIRFDGNSKTYADIQINGKDQHWNHKQLDAHGLFLIALADAINSQLIDYQSLKDKIIKLLQMCFSFFEAIEFDEYEDAGAWEEIERVNTSSIALITNAAYQWLELKKVFNIPITCHLEKIFNNGLIKVKQQIDLGGESPNYAPEHTKHRKSDAALLHIMTPSLLKPLDYSYYKKLLDQIKPLERPYGIIRYHNDSYQAANFWLNVKEDNLFSLTDDTSTAQAFITRQQKMPNNTEAQWFFDSLIALSHLALNRYFPKQVDSQLAQKLAAKHIKRALAQITAVGSIGANGEAIGKNQLPESINTVILNDQTYYLPSPITPLNWAKAALALALKYYANDFD